jgi:anion-transporting  ArsA/GET3 family ATPase
VAEAYADRARKTGELLRDPSVTEFRIVTTPHKAVRDADFFTAELRKRNFRANMICINRAWLRPLDDAPREGLAKDIAGWYENVSLSHQAAIAKVKATFAGSGSKICILEELARDVDGADALRNLETQLQSC